MLGSIFAHIQQIKPPTALSQSYANGVTIEGLHHSINRVDQSDDWVGNVKVTYGPTTITADRMTVHNDPDDPFGEAIGNVKLDDPEGVLTANDLNYHWKTMTGTGHTITFRSNLLELTAESIDVTPELWTLHKVGGTGCKLKTPAYYIRTSKLEMRPGKGVRATRPSLSIFGQKLITVPYYKFSTGDQGSSIHIPYPTYRSERGAGIDWTNAFDFGNQDSLFTKYVVFQRTLPFYNATFIHSFVDGRDPETPRTEIGDRLGFAYFDSVQVRDPASERTHLSTRRFDLGLASTFGADARDTTTGGDRINKPIEFLGQGSGSFAGFGALGIVRAQDIKVGNGTAINRLILEQNVISPSIRLGSNISLFGKIDAAEYSGGNDYSWIRGQAGIVFQPATNLRFGASYSSAKAHGVPDFAYDAPFRFREIGFRADLDFDTTQIRVLWKYDPSQRAIYDREFYLSRVIGCIEPYLVYRERPRKFFIGVKLPLTREFERLFRVVGERQEAIRHTISSVKD